MPYAQTSTSLGSLSAVGAGAWVAPPRGVNQVATGGGAGAVVLIQSSSVTSGGVVALEGRYRSGVDMDNAGASNVKELNRWTIAANGAVAVPLQDIIDSGHNVDEIRLNVISRTDGTFAGSVLTAA